MFNKKRTVAPRELVHEQKTQYQKEIAAVGLGALVIFLALAFFSYSPDDGTFFYYSSSQRAIANWSGVLGANIAAFFFYLLGAAAYLFLAILLVPLYMLIFSIQLGSEWRRLLMLLCFVVIAAMQCAMYGIELGCGTSGGFIGIALLGRLTTIAGAQGGQIVLWSLAWILAIFLVRFPLIPLVISLLGTIRAGMTKIFTGITGIFGRKKMTDTNDLVAEGASKTDVFDDDFFQLLQSPVGRPDELIIESPQQMPEAPERFVALALRRATQHVKIFKTPWALLPNTVLTRNIFMLMPDGTCPYLKICAISSSMDSDTFVLPDEGLFKKPSESATQKETTDQTTKRAKKVEEKLAHFGIRGSVVVIKPGPVVTMFEYKPDIDSKISKIVALEDDLAMALTAQSMRIIAPIPGKNVIGFEISNEDRQDVVFWQIFTSKAFTEAKAKLPIILGVDSGGNAMIADLASMPHLLVGGATGAGKSVGLNAMLLSLLCKLSPDHLKLILVDPKRLEFTPYADIPHLLFPIVTQASRAAAVLAWVVQEMEQRYDAMAAVGVRGVVEYRKMCQGLDQHKQMPYIVVIIDELADLMMVAGKDVEIQIVRIAQMARAAGIHLIIATQRPSVDVVTGLIKANFPSRVAFRVSSKIDSRTILDTAGAEKLLGKGDMLFMHASSPELKRVHGAYVSDDEVERVVEFLRSQRSVQYLDLNEVALASNQSQSRDMQDELYDQVRELIRTADEISISMIQRHYRIGFNRSARLIEKLELDGLVAPAQGSKPRKVLR